MFGWLGTIIAVHAPWLTQVIATATEGSGEKSDFRSHLPSLTDYLIHLLGPNFEWMERWSVTIFSTLSSVVLILLVSLVYRKREIIPGKLQNTLELLVESMYNFIYSMLGEDAKAYVPLVGTLFFYILMNNLWGVFPLGHSPSVDINITGSLALVVFLVVQYTGIRRQGFGKYCFHFIGSPQNVAMWIMSPLFLIVHIVGEVAKPASLALRLFGNITGEDILVGAFVGLGIMALGIFGHGIAENTWIGIPLNIPFIFLGLLLSTIQALVFTTLATIYILLMLPHEEHH